MWTAPVVHCIRRMIFRLLFIALFAGGMLGSGCKTRKSPDKSTRSPSSRSTRVPKSAVVSTNASREIKPEDLKKQVEAMARFATGISYDLNEKPDRALEEYYKSASLRAENSTFVIKTAQRLLQDNQTEKAIEVLSKATTQRDATSTVFALLARAYLQTGATNKAVAASQTALKKLPDSLLAYENLAEIYFQVGKPGEAIKLLEQAASQPKVEAAFLINLVDSYSKYLQLHPKESDAIKTKAIEVLNRAIELKPRSPTLQQKMADAMNQFGERKKAAEIYARLIEKYSDLAAYRDMLREKLANIYLFSNERELAVEQLEALIRDNPTKYPQAYYILGTISFEDKKFDKAADYFNRTLVLNADLEQAYYDLAGTYINLDNSGEALKTLEKARAKFPQNFVAAFYAGLAHQRMKNHAEALKHFTAAEVIAGATDQKRLDYQFYFQVGSCFERGGDYAQAEKYFYKALEKKPDDAETLNYMGYMWAERGSNLEKARELIDKALKQEPKNPAFLDSLGWVLFKLNLPEQALPYLLQSAELSKQPDPTIYHHLGDVYFALKNLEKAREFWKKSLDLESNDAIKEKLALPL